MIDFISGLDISDAASITFALAMKKMATIDGEVHPAEEEMINSFLEDLSEILILILINSWWSMVFSNSDNKDSDRPFIPIVITGFKLCPAAFSAFFSDCLIFG